MQSFGGQSRSFISMILYVTLQNTTTKIFTSRVAFVIIS